MRVLVTGGRWFDNRMWLREVLSRLHRERTISILAHGACPVGKGGADTMSGEWAREIGIPVQPFPVNHEIDGPWPYAGPKRNARMFRMFDPDFMVAFPGDRGTGHMVSVAERAKASGHRVEIIDHRKPDTARQALARAEEMEGGEMKNWWFDTRTGEYRHVGGTRR